MSKEMREMQKRWARHSVALDAVYAAMNTLVEEGAMPSEMRSHSAILIFDAALDRLIEAAEQHGATP